MMSLLQITTNVFLYSQGTKHITVRGICTHINVKDDFSLIVLLHLHHSNSSEFTNREPGCQDVSEKAKKNILYFQHCIAAFVIDLKKLGTCIIKTSH